MLQIIYGSYPLHLCEEGIGIGSISKWANQNMGSYLYGFDNNFDMLSLCVENNPWLTPYHDCIVKPRQESPEHCLKVTHGVLEHFSDVDILKIFFRYQNERSPNIHYVPTDAYKEQSFGDERLLPYQYWLDLVRPKDYLLFNNDHDLLLINL